MSSVVSAMILDVSHWREREREKERSLWQGGTFLLSSPADVRERDCTGWAAFARRTVPLFRDLCWMNGSFGGRAYNERLCRRPSSFSRALPPEAAPTRDVKITVIAAAAASPSNSTASARVLPVPSSFVDSISKRVRNTSAVAGGKHEVHADAQARR